MGLALSSDRLTDDTIPERGKGEIDRREQINLLHKDASLDVLVLSIAKGNHIRTIHCITIKFRESKTKFFLK